MVATQLRHVDDPDRPPQSPIPPLCEAQPHLHATLPCPRSFARAAICGGGGRSGFALPSSLARAHSRVPLFRKCSLAPPQRPIAPSRPLSPQPRIGATLRRAPLRGGALPPLPARPSLPPRPAANQRPAHRHRSLSEHNQPPPPSRIANGQRSQPSTRPGFRTSHRPPARPVTNAVAFGQLRAQRCRSRLALPGASPTASALPAADLPNTGTPPRKRRPASIAPAEAAPSPVAGDSTSSLPTNAPSHPTRHRPPPMPRPMRRRRNGHRGRRSWPTGAPSA